MFVPLSALNQEFRDGENNQLTLDLTYAVREKSISETVKQILIEHGIDISLLPISGCSAGGGVFQIQNPTKNAVIGVSIPAVAEPGISMQSLPDVKAVAADEIIIDQSQKLIFAGAAITLDQLNQALTYQLGNGYLVLGADLTSYTYAQVGATFMTGGMGPQRRYFSDSVKALSLFDGKDLRTVSKDELDDHAGTFGWTGLVTAVACHYVEVPVNEITFAIPVNSDTAALSQLIETLAPYCYFDTSNGQIQSGNNGANYIFGLEHLTAESMGPFLESGEEALVNKGKQLLENCQQAQCDGLIFVNGYSDLGMDEFLFLLVDNPEADEFTIAGINLEHTMVFNDSSQMRAIREGIPFAARTQAPAGKYLYKGHTDLTIRLNQADIGSSMEALWNCYSTYVQKIKSYFKDAIDQGIRGEILVYGHLNPYGLDPHNRITMAADDQDSFNTATEYVEEQRNILYRALRDLSEATQSLFIGGEKSAASEAEIFQALGTPDDAPELLKQKYKRQIKEIKKASRLFSWRAIPPYSDIL
jgi:hypothetical protein